MSWGDAVTTWGTGVPATWNAGLATWGAFTWPATSDAQGIRQTIADAARLAVPSGISVYAGPPDVVALPAIVVAPRSPYRELLTFTAEAVRVAVLVIVPRAPGIGALDLVDVLLDLVKPAVADVAGITEVGDVSSVVLATYGGADCVVASIDLTAS